MLGKYVDVAGGCGEGHVPRGVPRTPVCPGARGARTPSSPAVRMMARPAGRPRRPTQWSCARTRSAPGARRGRSRVEGRASVGVRGLGRDGEVDVGLLSGPPPANLARISSW